MPRYSLNTAKDGVKRQPITQSCLHVITLTIRLYSGQYHKCDTDITNAYIFADIFTQ
jgi:hypothetical protein